MNWVAIKMLIGDRGKYIGILLGITFASLLITHQTSTFVGLMSRTFGAITDMGLPDIWVMDPKVQFIDDIKPLQDTQLYRVRSVEGVEWAVPLYKGLLKARLENGNFQTCIVMGLDDATLVGGPPYMIEGKLEDLRRSEGIIVDDVSARTKLAKPPSTPGGRPTPLQVGDVLELNDHRAVVVGLCRVSRTFQTQPVLFTTYTRAVTFAPKERKLLSFVLVKAKENMEKQELCRRVEQVTGLMALTKEDFSWKTVMYFMKYTGIPINIGIGVIMAFIVGTAISGQTFYTFTLDNLRYFGALKAMGASNWLLLRMIVLQALIVGLVGFGLGVGVASFMGYMGRDTEMAWRLLWPQLIVTGVVVTLICMISAVISMIKVIRLEPAVVFRS